MIQYDPEGYYNPEWHEIQLSLRYCCAPETVTIIQMFRAIRRLILPFCDTRPSLTATISWWRDCPTHPYWKVASSCLQRSETVHVIKPVTLCKVWWLETVVWPKNFQNKYLVSGKATWCLIDIRHLCLLQTHRALDEDANEGHERIPEPVPHVRSWRDICPFK